MAEIFKAYDIRGVYPEDLNEEIAYKIGRAYATLIQNENKGKRLKIVVGMDMRLSSPQLCNSLKDGLVDQGIEVIDIGLCSSPTFYFAVGFYGADGGAQITASHNPKEYNGIKLVRKNAEPINENNGIQDIKKMVLENKFEDVKDKGIVEKRAGIMKEQIKHDFAFADVSKIKKLKVVVDPANAMGIQYIEEMFKHIPCELVKMNFEYDGNFPAHQPDPLQDETLIDLKKRVIGEKADLGIAPDGDGDRIFFIDDKGKTIEQSIIRGILAQIFLKEHPRAKICYDIRPGKITKDMIEEAGGIPVVTRVGHTFIKEIMIKENSPFAGESSGHFYVKTEYGSYEFPVIIILKLLQFISEKDKPVSEIIKPYEKYFQSGEINSEVDDKEGKIKELAKIYQDGKISYLDGITVEYDDFWFNVRASNTEPLLRLNLEAVSKSIMEKKRDEVLKVIRG